MKKSMLTRVLAALGGVTLWLLGLCALAETFFHVQVTAKIGQLLGAGKPLAVLAALLLAIALCAFGTCCLMMLSQKRAAKRSGFVMQKSENGVIGVSVKSIEGLVQTCVRQHDVIASAEISVVERKDGIVILLRIQEAAGVNIPLAVGALQKQIKQYVTDCTGVDVREVRVLVDNTDEEAPESPYAVKGPGLLAGAVAAAVLEEVPVVPAAVEENFAEELTAEEMAEETAVPVVQAVPVVPVGPAVPPMPEMPEEEDDRPLHQRLFGAEDEPVFVPAPPEMMEPEEEEIIEETAEEAVGVIAEELPEDIPAEAYDGNAVLEVVEAIAQEELLMQEETETESDSAEEDFAELMVEAESVPAEDEEKIPE